jgi:hypothetical protein
VEIVTAPGLVEWKMLIEHATQKLSGEFCMTGNPPN